MHKVNLKKPSITLKFANFFGAFGYLFTIINWLWIVGLATYPLIQSGSLDCFIPQNTAPAPPVTTTPLIPQQVALTIGIIVTLICFGIILYALYALPRTIGRTSAKLTHSTTKALVPVITQGKKVGKKEKRAIAFKISSGIKVAAATLPVLVAFLIPDFEALAKDVVTASTLITFAFAIFNFGTQWIIAKAAKLNTDQIW